MVTSKTTRLAISIFTFAALIISTLALLIFSFAASIGLAAGGSSSGIEKMKEYFFLLVILPWIIQIALWILNIALIVKKKYEIAIAVTIIPLFGAIVFLHILNIW